jgi:hypothetical protein
MRRAFDRAQDEPFVVDLHGERLTAPAARPIMHSCLSVACGYSCA